MKPDDGADIRRLFRLVRGAEAPPFGAVWDAAVQRARSRRRAQVYRFAAAVIVLAVVGAGWLLNRQHELQRTRTAKSMETWRSPTVALLDSGVSRLARQYRLRAANVSLAISNWQPPTAGLAEADRWTGAVSRSRPDE